MLVFPEFNPIALKLGPFSVHWYGLAYVVSLLLGLEYVKFLVKKFPVPHLTVEKVESLFIWVVLGVIVGGRLGYVLFYGGSHYLYAPLDVLKVWQGGMSFHGGFLGVMLALVVFAWRENIHVLDLGDKIAPAVPVGLFFGRIANFINGELVGRVVSDPEKVPWAMIFPHIDVLARHPSTLYEALGEGLFLGVFLGAGAVRLRWPRGAAVGIFLFGYAWMRVFLETFRTPEIVHHFAGLEVTQGQLLSLPMMLVGFGMLVWAYRGDAQRS